MAKENNMISEEITFNEIFTIHQKKLNYLNSKNKNRIAICFSGVPGAGKTTISKELEKELKAIRIEIDQIREIVANLFEQKNIKYKNNKNKYLEIKNQSYRYVKDLLQYIQGNEKNHLIILDLSLDRRYSYIKSLLDFFNYRIFSISLEADESQLRNRIKTRQTGMLDRSIYLKMLPGWIKDHVTFTSQCKFDICINTNKLTTEESSSEILRQFKVNN